MLTWEEDVEVSALHHRGWTISAIARHLGRSRTTIRAYVRGERQPGERRRSVPDPLAPYLAYVSERLREDPHVWATALWDEVRGLGYSGAYSSFTEAIRRRQLRPHCEACSGVRGRPTIEISHPAGEEIQWDFLELPAPWGGKAHLLVGSLAHSGKMRGVFCDTEDQAALVDGIDRVLRRLGGTARRWRFDRTSAVCSPATGAVLASFAAVAKHYEVAVDICPPRRGNRKGVVESRNRFAAQRWWRTAAVSDIADAQRDFDRFCVEIADGLPRGAGTVREVAAMEPLWPVPVQPYPATLEVERRVSASALVAFQGNRYSVAPERVEHQVAVRMRLGSGIVEVVAANGAQLARHHAAPAGAGVTVRSGDHHAALETAVLRAFTTAPPCRRKENRPPGPVARALAAALRQEGAEVTVDLRRYAELVEAAQ
jgi:transposase